MSRICLALSTLGLVDTVAHEPCGGSPILCTISPILFRGECYGQVGQRQASGIAHAGGLGCVVLSKERARLGLGGQIRWEALTGHDTLQVVSQENALGQPRRRVVLHNAALPALIDHVMVVRVVRRQAGRRAPISRSKPGRKSGFPPAGKASAALTVFRKVRRKPTG